MTGGVAGGRKIDPKGRSLYGRQSAFLLHRATTNRYDLLSVGETRLSGYSSGVEQPLSKRMAVGSNPTTPGYPSHPFRAAFSTSSPPVSRELPKKKSPWPVAVIGQAPPAGDRRKSIARRTTMLMG